jgi:hypothetical protein
MERITGDLAADAVAIKQVEGMRRSEDIFLDFSAAIEYVHADYEHTYTCASQRAGVTHGGIIGDLTFSCNLTMDGGLMTEGRWVFNCQDLVHIKKIVESGILGLRLVVIGDFVFLANFWQVMDCPEMKSGSVS